MFISLFMPYFLFMIRLGMSGYFGTNPYGHDWVLQYWSFMGMCEG
jgi:hypothetical protein